MGVVILKVYTQQGEGISSPSVVYSRVGLSGIEWESKYCAHLGIYVKVQSQNGSMTKSSEIRDSASEVD